MCRYKAIAEAGSFVKAGPPGAPYIGTPKSSPYTSTSQSLTVVNATSTIT